MMHLIGSGNALKDKYTGAIFLKPSDERERQLDLVCDIIRMAGEAGLRGLNYNITNLGHLRTERTLGRGGAILSTFNYDELLEKGRPREQEETRFAESQDGPADADEMWERIDYWLSASSQSLKNTRFSWRATRLTPGSGVGVTYRGVDRVLGMPESFKKLIDLYNSPYNGMNFCVGCMSEALENPAETSMA